jgi:hypothetical protein
MEVTRMSVDPNVILAIATELQKAKDTQEVTEVWHRYLIFLEDYRLIYSYPGESDIVLPSKAWPRNFPKGGFLRPLFAHDNMFFLNRRIAEEQRCGVMSPVKMDSTVEFDTNVASYVEEFVENRSGRNSEKVKEVLDFVVTNDLVNFAYNFYAMENARGFYDGSRVGSIRRNLRSIMKLDYIDRKKYQDTGKVHAVITDQELDLRADEKLNEIYDARYEEGMRAEYTPINEMLYLLLLKMVETQYKVEKRKLATKMEEFYEFMHFELKRLFVREAIIALHFFKNPSKLDFFGKFKEKRGWTAPALSVELRNMSWDLMLFRVMDRLAAIPGQGDFLIPYFLTFDRKMVQLFDLFPLKAVLAYGDAAQMTPLWETEPVEALRKEVDTTNFEVYFGEIATRIRRREREADPQPDLSGLRINLEQDVVSLMNC